MAEQLPLPFGVRVEKMPTCPFDPTCGTSYAEFDAPQESATCITTEFRCLTCGARGVESIRKDLPKTEKPSKKKKTQ